MGRKRLELVRRGGEGQAGDSGYLFRDLLGKFGIGPLPCFIADAKPNLVRLSDINADFAAGLWLLTHPDLRQSARVRAFMDFMAAEIGKQRRWIEGNGRKAA